ncbi:MAG: DUF732 domain-containing protein [Mycobacterium sp.]|jgi:hypothetical protein
MLRFDQAFSEAGGLESAANPRRRAYALQMERVLPTIVAALLITAACGSSSDAAYLGDLNKRGVDVGVRNDQFNEEAGRGICNDLKAGTVGTNEVINVKNHSGLTESQAEIAVYWAITDLCPDQSAQRQDHWKDGQ